MIRTTGEFTVVVLFPDGERRVPARYTQTPDRDDPAYLRHVPTLEPVPEPGWAFMPLMAGGWVAVKQR